MKRFGLLCVALAVCSTPLWAATRSVCASGCTTTIIQTAIDASSCGDTITLKAAEVYTVGAGALHLSNQGDCSTNPITITSDTIANIPAAGTRLCIPFTVTGHPEQTWTCATDHSALMPKIRGAQTPLLMIRPLARGWTINGIEFDYTDTTATSAFGTMILGGNKDDDATAQDDATQLPSHITFAHVYVHGSPSGQTAHGIIPNIKNVVIRDSVFRYFGGHDGGGQSAVLDAWNTPGPMLFDNNEINSNASQGIIIGGDIVRALSRTVGADEHPCDVTVTNNWFTRPLTSWKGDANWDGKLWFVANQLEFKDGCRVTASHNVIEYTWPTIQLGTLFTLVPLSDHFNFQGTEYMNCPNCTVKDVVFENNILRHSNIAMGLSRYDIPVSDFPTLNQLPRPERVTIRNNLAYDISERWNWPGAPAESCPDFTYTYPCGQGKFLSIGGGFKTTVLSHNTIDHQRSNRFGISIVPGQDRFDSLTFKDNFFFRGADGVRGDGHDFGSEVCAGEGTPSINGCDEGTPVWLHNVITDAHPSLQDFPGNPPVSPAYPATTTFIDLTAWNLIHENSAIGDYRVKAGSTYKAGGALAATDGSDIGVNMCNGAFPDPTTAAGPTVGKTTFSCGTVIPNPPANPPVKIPLPFTIACNAPLPSATTVEDGPHAISFCHDGKGVTTWTLSDNKARQILPVKTDDIADAQGLKRYTGTFLAGIGEHTIDIIPIYGTAGDGPASRPFSLTVVPPPPVKVAPVAVQVQ